MTVHQANRKGPLAMLVIMTPGASPHQIEAARRSLEPLCVRVDVSTGHTHTVIGLIGDEAMLDPDHIASLDGVQRVVRVEEPYKLVALSPRGRHSTVMIGGVAFGQGHAPLIAGPCAVESYEQMLEAAKRVQAAGAQVLRGEPFKPRTSPYAFQGLGEEGLRIMRQVAAEVGMPFVAEVLDIRDLDAIVKYADCVRIGARNMQNFALLAAVGSQKLPVILKRGLSATYEEWLMAAEYVAAHGNGNIILCERGIRTFETGTRNTPDLAAIPIIQGLSHLPVIFDPSHGVGIRSAVAPLALAGLAAGADGLMIDVHPNPSEAKVDGAQAITPDAFDGLMDQLKAIAPILGKKL